MANLPVLDVSQAAMVAIRLAECHCSPGTDMENWVVLPTPDNPLKHQIHHSTCAKVEAYWLAMGGRV